MSLRSVRRLVVGSVLALTVGATVNTVTTVSARAAAAAPYCLAEKAAVTAAEADLLAKTNAFRSAKTALVTALETSATAASTLNQAKAVVVTAVDNTTTAAGTLNAAKEAVVPAVNNSTTAASALNQAKAAVVAAVDSTGPATSTLNQAKAALLSAVNNSVTAADTFNQAKALVVSTLATYTAAKTPENLQGYQAAVAQRDSTKTDYYAAMDAVAAATTQRDSARAAYYTATDALTAAIAERENAKTGYYAAMDAVAAATTQRDSARAAYNTATDAVTAATAALDTCLKPPTASLEFDDSFEHGIADWSTKDSSTGRLHTLPLRVQTDAAPGTTAFIVYPNAYPTNHSYYPSSSGVVPASGDLRLATTVRCRQEASSEITVTLQFGNAQGQPNGVVADSYTFPNPCAYEPPPPPPIAGQITNVQGVPTGEAAGQSGDLTVSNLQPNSSYRISPVSQCGDNSPFCGWSVTTNSQGVLTRNVVLGACGRGTEVYGIYRAGSPPWFIPVLAATLPLTWTPGC